jgi:(1->4)-alpha-D-glucan 1-alpha-D-glucosylmutase
MPDPDDTLDARCGSLGIALRYRDNWGVEHATSQATKRALLQAIGQDPAQTRRLLIHREGDTFADVPMAPADGLRWRVDLEDGRRREGACQPQAAAVRCEGFADLSLGYHTLTMLEGGTALASLGLAVCPPRCAMLDGSARAYGPAIQLYALRSARNWGIGDFTDLSALASICARHGADFIGVNPLHELFLDRPAQASPYSPSSRLALNPMYLDVEAIDDYGECDDARRRVAAPPFQARLAALRDADLVDYEGVAGAKWPVLVALFDHFSRRHLTDASARGLEFRRFSESERERVFDAALFDALQAHCRAANGSAWGWPAWPEAYRDPTSDAVSEFARTHGGDVDFYLYLQWQADLQLRRAAQTAHDAGMRVGVYRDLAVGANPGGAETWAEQSVSAAAVHVGAPPDAFNPGGQDWGLPPWIPQRLAGTGYAPWIALLRANMRHAGALRIDHVMGLSRLFWIPQGMKPSQGAYVAYPLADLLALLALESVRNACLVVGEDLGTVADDLRQMLADAGVYSYRVLYFERDATGGFLPPDRYPAQALVTISTQDLPTLHGFWQGSDIAARDALGLFPDPEARDTQYAARDADRAGLRDALAREGLPSPAGALGADDVAAIHTYAARTPCALMTLQLEDVFGQAPQANLPGTTDDQYPNWRRKVAVDLADWERDGRFGAVCAAIRAPHEAR